MEKYDINPRDYMNGDWDKFDKGMRRYPPTPDECYGSERCNPYPDNCFKTRKRFWTKERCIDYLINAVLLGLFFWALFSI